MSLAFAWWCFADMWVEYAEGKEIVFARLDPLWAVVVPAVAVEMVIALAMFGVWEWCRRKKLGRFAGLHLLFLALCLVPLGIGYVGVLQASPAVVKGIVANRWLRPALLLAGVGYGLWRPVRASRLVRGALLYSWPVLLLLMAQAWRHTLSFPASAYADGTLAAPLPAVPGHPRVVWILFDELSQTIAFDNRPAGLELPNFDRLKQQSFYATAAEAPTEWTEFSLPSLIVGDKVTALSAQQPDDLGLVLSSHRGPVSWSSFPNVFDDARDLKLNTALVGWFLPYGRVLNGSLTRCAWMACSMSAGAEEPLLGPHTLLENMWARAQFQISDLPLIDRIPFLAPNLYERREQMDRLHFLRARALETVSDPSIGLALLHLPVPHPPPIYSRKDRAFAPRKRLSYLDSVALADRELGLLRQAMENAGLWDQTAVLVTADHGWRWSMWEGLDDWTPEDETVSHQNTMRVPFLLKLPGETSGRVENEHFNTIVTRRLITAFLKGQIAGPDAVSPLLLRF